MSEKVKQAEIQIIAESEWGIERACAFANAQIQGGIVEGEHTIGKHGIKVVWRVADVTIRVEVPKLPSVIPPDQIEPPEIDYPDVSKMDIEDAKGMIGVSPNLEELDAFEWIERNSDRYPGGRKGVLKYIDDLRAEIGRRAEAEAEEDARVARMESLESGDENPDKE